MTPSGWCVCSPCVQMMQQLVEACTKLKEAMHALWIDPSAISFEASDCIGSGISSTVYRGMLHGSSPSAAAIKVYDRIRLGPAAVGAAGINQLLSSVLRRELCIIARASKEFHYVCK
jgi:hypothetical protein